MQVVLLTTFAASRKEPLEEMVMRVHQGFLDAGISEPQVNFNFADAMAGSRVSSVDRVLKRHPDLEIFLTTASPVPGIPGGRRLSNGPLSPAAGKAAPYETLRAIVAGVPRSFPFHQVALQFHAPLFGTLEPGGARSAEMLPGILVSDNWWVNGRERSLSACTLVVGDAGSRKLPPLPPELEKLFAACGKVKKRVQVPLSGDARPGAPMVRSPVGIAMASADPKAAMAVHPIVMDYRARMPEIVERAALPHDLPSASEALRGATSADTTGPRKPALDEAFRPLGYSCKRSSGSFVLRRRTAAHLTCELALDVGTWGHSVLAMFKVWGLGFKATLMVPVTRAAIGGAQYPIAGEEAWRRIVANLAALIAELERTFVPAIEAAAGPSPEWYQPES